MTIAVDCLTGVITIPFADLSYVSPGLYELDVEDFRLWLKDWEDSEIGIAMPDTHRRNAPVTLSGTTYAQTFEILAPYTVEFEYLGTSYTVRVVGGNHNIGDRKVVNPVSIIIGNSAGLIAVDTGGGGTAPTEGEIAAAVWAYVSRTLSGMPQVDVRKMNGADVIGTGQIGDDWRGVGVPPG